MRPAHERLRERRDRLAVQAKKSLGQNFLVSDSVIGKIWKAVEELKPASLLEIGPGLGALTDGLKEMKAPLTLIELDSKLAEYWRQDGCTVIEADALQWSWNLEGFARPCVLVSNLPYQISSSLVIDRCMDEKPLDGMVLMFQKEVAQRMKATIHQGPYGFLSVVAQTFWKIDLLLEASSGDFSPPPKVASRVLVFVPKPSPVRDRRRYLKFLKACFLHPRKYLLSNLAEGVGLGKEEVRRRFEEGSWDPRLRADQLSPEKFLELFRRFED
jgi:16S rRNA (adenine1518-N6/adenine1519-N6)-dimethyltransferase